MYRLALDRAPSSLDIDPMAEPRGSTAALLMLSPGPSVSGGQQALDQTEQRGADGLGAKASARARRARPSAGRASGSASVHSSTARSILPWQQNPGPAIVEHEKRAPSGSAADHRQPSRIASLRTRPKPPRWSPRTKASARADKAGASQTWPSSWPSSSRRADFSAPQLGPQEPLP